MSKRKVIIIHPGVQHAYRLANALSDTGMFSSVSLHTWFVLKKRAFLSSFKKFRKRVKSVNDDVKIVNYPLFELGQIIHERIFFFFFPQLRNRNYNNIQYLWSLIFNYFMLPSLYWNRKNSVLIVFDTCGWPLSYYAKRWNIPVVMDFPSISHEGALILGIEETQMGIRLKVKERNQIDYALYCSDFAKETYKEKTTAKRQYTAHVGAELQDSDIVPLNHSSPDLNIAFIANMEFRKGLDLLLEAVEQLNIPYKLHLIGKISAAWVSERANALLLNSGKIVFAGSFDQAGLTNYLRTQNVQLHILPSRFDSFGMVVPETMMLGIANIVSPFVGAGEKIDHGRTGFIMKDLSAAEITAQILRYYELPPAKKQELSRNSFDASRQISWSQYTDRISQIFKEINEDLKPRIAFLVTHPTQFEVPFYQFVSRHDNASLDVIYINTQLEGYYDQEIGKNVIWGFNLLQGYNYFHLRKGHQRRDLKNILKKNNYDLVITNGYNGPYLKYLDILFRHPGYLALRLDSIIRNQPKGWKLWKAPLLRLFFSRFDRLFAVGNLSRAYLHHLGQPSEKIGYFSYSIDRQRFEAADIAELNELRHKLKLQNQKVFLCVSKLVKRESPIDVIEAFIAAKRKDWTLLIAGAGREMDSLVQWCAQYPQANVIFLGYVPYKDLASYYHIADIFVHSTLEENWGVSVHEAIAANCTVITSDTVGSAFDLIEAGRNGYTYPYRDTAALMQMMEKALRLDPLTKRTTNERKLTDWGYPRMWEQITDTLSRK